ncbi:post-PEP-CTERM-1 domain-containing protein [Pseudomarimonas salicorniae]|uniref:Peptidase propeptide and YPEB domain-containing protein n=1 Tax=Pseudomarimonas salicorniae TaxID=2933270 RepID=A0ABT0GJK6_9GAMM|nr:hypothetical protein [Lysobacter sp. CAU 1642]MCK7594542.1 hypothetical protein [Lysobacter sp. CAU 1642]
MKTLQCGAICVALALVAPLAGAAESGKGGADAPAMRAAVDPATGRFRPLSEAEQQALEAQGLDRSSALSQLRAQQAKRGQPAKSAVVSTPYGESMDVPDEYLVQLRATRDADGVLKHGHGDPRLDGHAGEELPNE